MKKEIDPGIIWYTGAFLLLLVATAIRMLYLMTNGMMTWLVLLVLLLIGVFVAHNAEQKKKRK